MKLIERMGLAKEASLDGRISAVHAAWSQLVGDDAAWVSEVYEDHAIVCWGEDHYSVPYSVDDAGVVTFDAAAATEVEREWVEVGKAELSKIDDDRHLAFGWAYVAERGGERVIDHSGEFIEKADLEDAAYRFVLTSREADELHTAPVVGQLVESFMVTPEKLTKMGLAPDALPAGWWTGWYIPDDEVWGKVRDGQYRMLSIGGNATRELVDA